MNTNATKAAEAIELAEVLETRARLHSRASAALAGASSDTHTHRLLAGWCLQQAQRLREEAAQLARQEVR